MNNELIGRRITKKLRHYLDDFKHTNDGYVELNTLLKSDEIFKNVKLDTIKSIVNQDSKQRLSLKFTSNQIFIRANQGHSSGKLKDEKIFQQIFEPIEGCFHGTYWSNLKKINISGLSRMNRKHIHIAESENSISGKRKSCQVKIFINMKLALNDGIKFYRSENSVILTPGNQEGFLLPKYFSSIESI